MLGLNHNTAPIAVRERFAVPDDKLAGAYAHLLSMPCFSEALILSTCNRVEYYVCTDELDTNALLAAVSELCGLDGQIISKYSYLFSDADAVKHLAAVASSVDSLVVGEPQILGQVKDAFISSHRYNGLGVHLGRLRDFVFRTAKRIRTYTAISENAVSVSYAAVDLAKKIFGSLANKRALIIGAGEMCELVAGYLASANIGEIIITNRTYSKACELARKVHGKVHGMAIEFAGFAKILPSVDITISSTGSHIAIVNKDMVAAAMEQRKHAPMFFIDIAVPRDIAADVDELDNVYVYDMDDLAQVVDTNRILREGEAKKAMAMIASAYEQFEQQLNAIAAAPVIKKLREYADELAEKSLQTYCRINKITNHDDIASVRNLLVAYTNKLLHKPIIKLKSSIAAGEKVFELM
ncbi:glutamyl-tRNA reductase [Deferribacterales bacterium RsTz2092]